MLWAGLASVIRSRQLMAKCPPPKLGVRRISSLSSSVPLLDMHNGCVRQEGCRRTYVISLTTPVSPSMLKGFGVPLFELVDFPRIFFAGGGPMLHVRLVRLLCFPCVLQTIKWLLVSWTPCSLHCVTLRISCVPLRGYMHALNGSPTQMRFFMTCVTSSPME